MSENAQRSSAATRQRILRAAMIRFARHPYEETKLRDIATDAEIDVAMVHRAFGSKEQLFIEVVRAAVQARTTIEEQTDPPEQAFAREIFDPLLDRTFGLVDPMDIMVQSLSSAQAAPILRDFILEDVIDPIAARTADVQRDAGRPPLTSETINERAALAAACMTGIVLFRQVLKIDLVGDDRRARLEPLIRAVLSAALHPAP
ncbi:TetR/AcrR family transcriptional regulator [Tistrella mobilis]|jgi:AcrR family transcriptional regulator|uniref:TetR/AcrR family transcriptional regulator n=1 Tax=Tistrella mobilis TaxID=171437 RepID=UPI0035580845